jgi:hypothetical protein
VNITKSWGARLLAIWLVLTGLIALVPELGTISGVLMSLLALVAGVLILVDR